ncbi:hypothetical protein HPP92_017956 [Vanilla planifolia]|uniref:Uncharacterized protein n=1 Tax=Vanilla planifolia TaxID=51239 RepID=A0A835QC24_VANPL|nr:hypothetical protein HPP92_017956 [Vanilla planifolia]
MRWPALFAAWLRRRLLDAVLCGVSAHNRRKGKDPCGIVPRLTPPEEPWSERLARAAAGGGARVEGPETRPRRGERLEKLFEEMQSVVRRLRDGGEEGCDRRRMEAAANARRLAKTARGEEDARDARCYSFSSPSSIRRGPIPRSRPSMLLNLGIGNDVRGSEGGAVLQDLDLIETGPPAEVAEAIVANFLGLSALDANKPIIGASSGAIPFLVSAFQNADTNSG